MKKWIALVIAAFIFTFSATAFALIDEKIPMTWEGHTGTGDPYLQTYILESDQDVIAMQSRPAVIICPGGGYSSTSNREAEPVAMKLTAAGIHAFVLRYSVYPAKYPTAVLELAYAVKTVRESAAEWSINPDEIYIMGFSAGGHLCATLGTKWDDPLFADEFGLDNGKDWKPNGMVLCYPVITMGENTNITTRNGLLGRGTISQEQIEDLSAELHVTALTPRTFLWHTQGDTTVSVQNSLMFADALQKAGVPFELHIYEQGQHGGSVYDDTTARGSGSNIPDNATWVQLAINWILAQ